MTSTTAPTGVPAWFHNAIVTGAQRIYTLMLPGSPAGESLQLTVYTWIDALWSAPVQWDEAADAPRLDAMFTRLALRADRWPAPRTLMEWLPERAPPALLARPHTPPSDAVRARLAALGRRRTDDTAEEGTT
jgi:hypothetical protein